MLESSGILDKYLILHSFMIKIHFRLLWSILEPLAASCSILELLEASWSILEWSILEPIGMERLKALEASWSILELLGASYSLLEHPRASWSILEPLKPLGASRASWSILEPRGASRAS